MKYILLLIFIVYINNYIPSYYNPCQNPPKGGFTYIGTSECRKYSSSNGFCCLLVYYVENANHQNKSRYEECIGISKNGYENIYDLVVDIEEDRNLGSVQINCSSKMLGLFYISLLLFILIIN